MRDKYRSAWELLRPPEWEGGVINGILINISALSTFNDNGQEGVGGVGQSRYVEYWQKAIGQKANYDSGGIFRGKVAVRAGMSVEELSQDGAMLRAMNIIGPAAIAEIDRMVDLGVAAFAIEQLAHRSFAVVGTKVLPLILDKIYAEMSKTRNDIFILNVGVDAENGVAIRRKARKEKGEGAALTQADLEVVERRRIERMEEDVKKYGRVHGVAYSRKTMLENTHVQMRNSRENNPEYHPDAAKFGLHDYHIYQFWEMMMDISEQCKVKAPFLGQLTEAFTGQII